MESVRLLQLCCLPRRGGGKGHAGRGDIPSSDPFTDDILELALWSERVFRPLFQRAPEIWKRLQVARSSVKELQIWKAAT